MDPHLTCEGGAVSDHLTDLDPVDLVQGGHHLMAGVDLTSGPQEDPQWAALLLIGVVNGKKTDRQWNMVGLNPFKTLVPKRVLLELEDKPNLTTLMLILMVKSG